MSTIHRFRLAVAIVFVVLVLGAPNASAKTPHIVKIPLRMGIGLENFYVSNAGGSVSCNGGTQFSQAPSFFNTAGNWSNPKVAGKIGPADTVFLCGTLTASAGALNYLACQGSGSSGNPITIKWDTNAIVQAPYFGESGFNCSGFSWIVIDGGTNGKIQNTANGDALANQQFTQLMVADAVSNFTIQNLEFANAYVHIQGTQEKVDHQQNRALEWSGSNLLFQNNYVHDCGWCLNNGYLNDTNVTYQNNHWDNFEHGLAIYDGSKNVNSSGFYILNNHFGNMANWDCGTTTSGGITSPNCHHDPIHIFANAGDGATTTEIYIGNNLWDGNVGCCETDEIFIEGGASPAQVGTLYVWNNVFEVISSCLISDSTECPSNGQEVNTQGWVGLFSATTRAIIVNNTVIGLDVPGGTCPGVTLNGTSTATCHDPCWGVGAVGTTPTIFHNNVALQCAEVIQTVGATAAAADWDYNYYGQACYPMQNTDQCFLYQADFNQHWFGDWQTASGWDAHGSTSYTGPGGGLVGSAQPSLHVAYSASSTLFNANGSPQANSPVIGTGTNLTSLASTYPHMASITSDTTAGGTRTATARPSTGSWDVGAFQFSSSPPPSNPARVLITWTN